MSDVSSESESALLRAARMYVKGYEPPWPQPADEILKVGEFKEDPTELACAYVDVHDKFESLRVERDALLAVLESLLVAVEPVRFSIMKDIDKQVEANQEWAKKYNATRGNSNEMWFYNAEFRHSLEMEVEPFTKAIREANEVYDRIKLSTVS